MLSANQKWYLLGHRAARAELLENSEQGFAYVQKLQQHGNRLDGVEFDVQMTADGAFVVVHDDTFKRLAQQQAWIADSTVNELNTITQSDWVRFGQLDDPRFIGHKVLLLNDLLPYLRGFRHIELEIKTHAKTNQPLLVQNLLRLLSQPSWQQLPITLTSFDTDILYHIQSQQQFLPFRFSTGLLLAATTTLATQIAFLPPPNTSADQFIAQVFNRACALGCSQVGIYYGLITPKLVNIAKMYGLNVTAWTVNEVAIAKQLINIGVDCVITDYPTTFLTMLSE